MGNVSKLQDMVYKIMILKYGKERVFLNIRPKWLKNIQTNKKMELDILIPSQNLAIEINGEQHYEKVDFFSNINVFYNFGDGVQKLIGTRKNNNALEELKFRDKQKKIICEYLGIKLFTIKSDNDINELYNYLQDAKQYIHTLDTLADFLGKTLFIKYEIYAKLYEELLTRQEFEYVYKVLKTERAYYCTISSLEPKLAKDKLVQLINESYNELNYDDCYMDTNFNEVFPSKEIFEKYLFRKKVEDIYLSDYGSMIYSKAVYRFGKELKKYKSRLNGEYCDGNEFKNIIYNFIPYPSFGRINYVKNYDNEDDD